MSANEWELACCGEGTHQEGSVRVQACTLHLGLQSLPTIEPAFVSGSWEGSWLYSDWMNPHSALVKLVCISYAEKCTAIPFCFRFLPSRMEWSMKWLNLWFGSRIQAAE